MFTILDCVFELYVTETLCGVWFVLTLVELPEGEYLLNSIKSTWTIPWELVVPVKTIPFVMFLISTFAPIAGVPEFVAFTSRYHEMKKKINKKKLNLYLKFTPRD